MTRPSAEKTSNSRAQAARILAGWLESGRFPDRDVDEVSAAHGEVLELVHGVVRWRRRLEVARDRLVRRPPPPDTNAVLLVGLYQVLLAHHVPDHAAVNENVEAAKILRGRNAADFVNAVLRRAIATKPDLQREMDQKPLAVRESHPDLLVARWVKRYGEAATQKLCAWNNQPADVVARVIDRRFLDAVPGAVAHPARPETCFILPRGQRVSQLPGYAEGWFTIQDPSTLAAPELLEPLPGETVLDACAAPGGKTLILAEKMQGRGRLVAMDVHEDRLVQLKQNLARLNHREVEPACADAANPGALRKIAPDGFDRILLDVPCSNTGVIRRRPDARWRFSGERLKKLIRTQRALLDGAASSVKPGGSLVYSTCSLESEENEDQVRAWLAAHAEFSLQREVKSFPPESGTDGAYAARLVRAPLT